MKSIKKTPYIPPFSEVVKFQTNQNVADFFIVVSGTTTPEDSDSKKNSFEEDDEDNDMSFLDFNYKAWEEF